METIKYEAVFGDQAWFDLAPPDAIIAFIFDNRQELLFDNGLCDAIRLDGKVNILAMRRIIKTPVWTVADQQAGRLPEVGCKALGLFDKVVSVTSVDIKNGWLTVQYENDQCVDIYRLSNLTPIETQEERAQRLRDEWKSKVDQIVTESGSANWMDSINVIHDALLSGELQSPKDLK